MKRSISIITVLFSILFAIVGGVSAEIVTGGAVPAFGVAGVLTLVSFIPFGGGGAFMAITKEIWINDIVENLFKANPHLEHAFNADSFVIEGKVVHIPNAGSKPTVTRNRSSLPAAVIQRTDADITFSIDEFTTPPALIKDAEKVELSYDKRMSVMGQHINALVELVGDWFFYYWAPSASAQILRTTGDAIAAHTTDATGNRKSLTVTDIKKAAKTMNANSVPQMDRYATLDADMYDQLLTDLSPTDYKDFSKAFNHEKGIIGELYGFKFLAPRATVLTYTNETTPVVKAPGAAGAAADNAGGLFWHKDSVIRALGDKKVFEDTDNPTYYGDLISALLRAGGRKRRNDAYGVVAIVQAAS